MTSRVGADKTDIDLRENRITVQFNAPKEIHPEEIVQKGLSDTVTVDRMVLESSGRIRETENGLVLEIHETGQKIPLDGSPPERRMKKGDVHSFAVYLSGWRPGEDTRVIGFSEVRKQ